MEQEIGAVYCRLSQDDGSAGESGSIQTQRTLLTQYCAKSTAYRSSITIATMGGAEPTLNGRNSSA